MKKPKPKNIGKMNPFSILFLLAIIGAGVSILFSGISTAGIFPKAPEKVSISEFLQKYKADEFKEILVGEETVTGETLNGEKFESVKEISANSIDLGFTDSSKKAEIKIDDSTSSKDHINSISKGGFLFTTSLYIFFYWDRFTC